jgi:hypothetical protein
LISALPVYQYFLKASDSNNRASDPFLVVGEQEMSDTNNSEKKGPGFFMRQFVAKLNLFVISKKHWVTIFARM